MSQHILQEKVSKSAESCTNSMAKHFNNFFSEFIEKEENRMKYRNDITFQSLKSTEVTNDLVGCFLNYLVTATSNRKGSSNQEISYQSMISYASSFKTNLLKRFTNEKEFPVALDTDHYKIYTNAMKNRKVKQINLTDKPVFGSYDAASEEDIKAIFTLSFWSNDQSDAEFFALMIFMLTSCGRGSEVCKTSNKFISFIIYLSM